MNKEKIRVLITRLLFPDRPISLIVKLLFKHFVQSWGRITRLLRVAENHLILTDHTGSNLSFKGSGNPVPSALNFLVKA